MKKMYLLMAALMTLGTVNANVIWHESFDREVGDLKVGKNTEMGTNNTDWWCYSGDGGASPKYIQVTEGGLSFAGYQSDGAGNKATLAGDGADDLRQFNPVTSGSLFVGVIINVETLKGGTNPDHFLSFGDASASNMFGRINIRSVKENDEFVGFQLGVSKFSETLMYTRFTNDVYEAGKDYLVVMEYQIVEGDKNDEVRLWVNPTKDTKKPTLECVQDTTNTSGSPAGANSKKDADKLASVDIRQATNTPRKIHLDEIKVATAWADLFEKGETPEGLEEVGNQPSALKSRKYFRDGQLIIVRDGKEYNILGAEL